MPRYNSEIYDYDDFETEREYQHRLMYGGEFVEDEYSSWTMVEPDSSRTNTHNLDGCNSDSIKSSTNSGTAHNENTSTYVGYSVEGLLTVSLYVKAESGKFGKDKVRRAIVEACEEALSNLSSGGEAHVDEYQPLEIKVIENPPNLD